MQPDPFCDTTCLQYRVKGRRERKEKKKKERKENPIMNTSQVGRLVTEYELARDFDSGMQPGA